jgi:iron complex outermembrane receptor protein
MSPSVNYSAVDTLGTNESGFHDSVRIRGKKQTGPGSVKSYDGVPISGNPSDGKRYSTWKISKAWICIKAISL